MKPAPRIVNSQKRPIKKTILKQKISKKAQDASSAATLVAVLALLIIFYLLFIPPSYRDQILEGNGTTTSMTSAGGAIKGTLLKASPGVLSPIKAEKIEHNIPALTLYSKTQSKVLQNTNSIYVKSSIFGQKKATISFNVDDVKNTKNALLTFRSSKHKGTLIVRLNGNEVYSGTISQENPEPIKLPDNYLLNGANNIEFEAEKTGWAFWRRNIFQMENLQVTADIKDTSRQESRNIFIVSATEKANVKRSILRFTPDCTTGRTGKLNVLINQKSIHYAIPDCGGRVAIEFPPEILREGENEIVFESEEGSYLIDLIRITSEMKAVVQPTYFFEMPKKDMDALKNGQLHVKMKITFVDSEDTKSAKININGRETNLYQTEREFEKNLDDYVTEGNNAIKISPETPLEIQNLEVYEE